MMRALVYGFGKATIGGSAVTFKGDVSEAELISPLVKGGDLYWVKFEGDVDEQGRQVERLRLVEKVL